MNIKKVFFASSLLSFLLIPLYSYASVGDDVYYTWEGVKKTGSESWKWIRYGTGVAMEKTIQLVDGTQKLLTTTGELDERLFPYVSGKDLAVIIKYGVDLKVVDEGIAGQQTATNNILVNLKAVEKMGTAYGMSAIHHETLHVLDNQKMKEAGYSATDLGHVGTLTLDGTSQGILQAILEARAYAEQIGFVYENKLLHKNSDEWKKLYESMVKKETYAEAFDKAIRSGKNIDLSKKTAAIALLNSDFFHKGYLKNWVQYETDNLKSLSAEEIFKILGEDLLSLEDFMSAEQFWKNLCSFDQTKDSDPCLAFFASQKSKCREVEEKWTSCNRLGATLAGDKLGARLFTTDEDDKLYDACCK